MPRLTLWKGFNKGNNYKFVDNTIKQTYIIGGTTIYVHKYLGPDYLVNFEENFQSNSNPNLQNKKDKTQPRYENKKRNITDIQDLFYLENRNRRYSEDIYLLKGLLQVSDTDFDLRQFGLFLSTDRIDITFHYNDMVERLGRRLIPGDVLEIPFLRESQVRQEKESLNKFYVVQDAAYAAEGYSPFWYPHIWRCRCQAVQNQQEFYSILQSNMKNIYLRSLNTTVRIRSSTYNKEIFIMRSISREAFRQVPLRKFFTKNLYILENKNKPGYLQGEDFQETICLAWGDGEPPNGAKLVGKGVVFPENSNRSDYFLRIDFSPPAMFKRIGNLWRRVQFNWRSEWSPANRVLKKFINNNRSIDYQNTNKKIRKRQYISRVLKPDI